MGNDLHYYQDTRMHPRHSRIRLQTGNQMLCHSAPMETDYGEIRIARASMAAQNSQSKEDLQAGYLLCAA